MGKKRLDRAIATYQRTFPGASADTFTVSFMPFYLDPTAPAVGMPLAERMAQRFGPATRVAAMQDRLRQIGRAEGIDFAFDGRIGRTRDAHRLVQLAKVVDKRTRAPREEGTGKVENALVDALFVSYFERGGDITSHDMLAAAGVEAGIDEGEVRSWLAEGKGGKEVDEEVRDAAMKGIHGVPHFEIQGKYTVDGAQDVSAFLEEFAHVKADEE